MTSNGREHKWELFEIHFYVKCLTQVPSTHQSYPVKIKSGRDWGQEEKGTPEDEMAGWHHRLNGCEFE